MVCASIVLKYNKLGNRLLYILLSTILKTAMAETTMLNINYL